MSGRRTRAVYVISVAAELAGMHPQTLRQYERRGLLHPARTQGGNRRYSDDDIEVLRRVAELASEGMNLEGIRRVMSLEAENARLRDELARARPRHATPRSRPNAGSAAISSRCARPSPCSAIPPSSCASRTNPFDRPAVLGHSRSMAVDLAEHISAALPELRVHPTAKRIRAFVGGEPIIDSTRALIVWEPRRIVPSYAVPDRRHRRTADSGGRRHHG